MALALFRIDDRLIHGQVVQGWLGLLRVMRVVVADDEAAGDALQQSCMALAIPPGVALTVLTVADAARRLPDVADSEERVLLLVAGPAQALAIVSASVDGEAPRHVDAINVGGLHAAPGRRPVFPTVSVGGQDEAAFRDLARLGIRVEYRPLPTDPRLDLIEGLDRP